MCTVPKTHTHTFINHSGMLRAFVYVHNVHKHLEGECGHYALCVCVCWHCRTVTLFTFLSSNYPCINQLPHRSPVLHLLTSFSSSPETDYLNFLSMLTKARSNNVLCVVEEARDRSWGQWAYVLVTFLLCDCAFIYYFFNLYCPCFISIYRHMRQFVSLTLCAFMHIGVWSEC